MLLLVKESFKLFQVYLGLCLISQNSMPLFKQKNGDSEQHIF